MSVRRSVSGFVMALLVVPGVVFGQETPVVETKAVTVHIGQRTWLSTGASEFSFAGLGGVPNVLSELKWKQVASTVVEFDANALLFERYSLNIGTGFGAVKGGTLRDQDFAGNNRTQLDSDTISAAGDDALFFVNVDFGYRVLTWAGRNQKPRNWLDLLIGYQHWRERYIATQTIDVFPGTRTIDQGRALTNDFIWDSVRLGARSEIELLPDLSLRAKMLLIPWTRFQLKDIHHLRTTGLDPLLQDPSFEATTTNWMGGGGVGGQLDATLSYRVWHDLSLELGYQWWRINSGEGTITARTLGSGQVVQPFNGATTTRHGAIIGIHYRF